MAYFCKSCGAVVPDGANNCPACGAAVIPENTGANTVPPPPAGSNNGSGGYNYQQNTAGNSGQAFLGMDHTAEFDPADINENKMACGFVYLGITFFIPLVACPNSRFGKFHANQGLIFLLSCIAISVVSVMLAYLGAIPAIGVMFRILSRILTAVGSLAEIGLLIYGMVNTFTGKAVELPLIGRFTIIK